MLRTLTNMMWLTIVAEAIIASTMVLTTVCCLTTLLGICLRSFAISLPLLILLRSYLLAALRLIITLFLTLLRLIKAGDAILLGAICRLVTLCWCTIAHNALNLLAITVSG